MLVRAHQVLGAIAMRAGDYTTAERHFQLAFDTHPQHGNAELTGMAGTLLGRLAYERGDHAAATALLERSLVEQGDTFNPVGAGWALMTLARISSERGEHARAARQYAASLDLRLEYGDRIGCVASLRGLADVATAVGFHDLAARLLAAVEANAESLGLTLSGARRERFLLVIERVKAGMTPDAFSAAWQAGRQLTIDDAPDAGRALVRALEQPDRMTAPRNGTARIGPLSPRETDVLRLVAAGLSTAQIAEQLFLSPRTVTTHLTSIYNKLGFNSRVAAARFAMDNGLV
jgi:DNA-binding NarL/FixJ family response regulator